MPEETITIGGRHYQVTCQEGEEHFLQSAARLLDAEAQQLLEQMGRMPEPRMLLMAGLMLADKTAGLEEQLRAQQMRETDLERTIAYLQSQPRPEPERVEVPVVPSAVLDALEESAARAEALASRAEEAGRTEG